MASSRQTCLFHGERIIPARGLDVQRLSAAGQVLSRSPSLYRARAAFLPRTGDAGASDLPLTVKTGQVAAADDTSRDATQDSFRESRTPRVP